jgi:hypothetical protein
MYYHPLRLNFFKITLSLAVFWSILTILFSTAYADTCVDCHTSLEKLKKLAPSLPEPPKKLSEGEG